MVRTRNQVLKNNMIGAGWTEREEEHCYRLFFRHCQLTKKIANPSDFNKIFPQLTRELGKTCGKDFKPHNIKERIQMLRIYFQDFCDFINLPRVDYDMFANKATVTNEYYHYIVVESNINRFYHNYGFPQYSECFYVFNIRKATTIDFDGVPSYTRYNSLEIYGSSSDDEADDSMDDADEGHIERIPEWEFQGLPAPNGGQDEADRGQDEADKGSVVDNN